MQTYVVRIYRHNGERTGRLIGIVEEIENGKVFQFKTLEKLMAVLCPQKSSETATGRKVFD